MIRYCYSTRFFMRQEKKILSLKRENNNNKKQAIGDADEYVREKICK